MMATRRRWALRNGRIPTKYWSSYGLIWAKLFRDRIYRSESISVVEMFLQRSFERWKFWQHGIAFVDVLKFSLGRSSTRHIGCSKPTVCGNGPTTGEICKVLQQVRNQLSKRTRRTEEVTVPADVVARGMAGFNSYCRPTGRLGASHDAENWVAGQRSDQ
jgi:hypothetical protein